jgi:hypothetical protein
MLSLRLYLSQYKCPLVSDVTRNSIAMKKQDRYARKAYAMSRMTLAIERAIKRPTRKEKERAARWAAAWGLLCGIRTEGVNLKPCDVQSLESRIEQPYDSTITIASFSPSGLNVAVQPQFSPGTSPLTSLTKHAVPDRVVPQPVQPKPV